MYSRSSLTVTVIWPRSEPSDIWSGCSGDRIHQANQPFCFEASSPSTETRKWAICFTVAQHKRRQTLAHLNTLILSRNRCDFAKRAVFLQPPTVFCFTGHTGSSRSLVIELVGWRHHSLLPLLESMSCRLPTDQKCGQIEWIAPKHSSKTKACNNGN